MKVLIFISCAFALASASLPYLHSNLAYQHIPLITSNGVPVETPEVQAAKSQHYAAHLQAKLQSGGVAASIPAVSSLSLSGLPLDTPEVAAAKAQHYHDYAVAAQRNGVAVGVSPVSVYGYASSYNYPAIGVDGSPIETAEVQAAKAQHFAAHARAGSGVLGSVFGTYFAQPQAAIGADGQPIETPEVQAAKANHFAAHAAARSNSGTLAYGAGYGYNVPVIGPNGVPVETPEVQAAKASHLAAHIEAKTRSGILASPLSYSAGLYGGGYSYNVPVIGADGVPVETPEVQAAKASHLAAHIEAKQRASLGPVEKWQW